MQAQETTDFYKYIRVEGRDFTNKQKNKMCLAKKNELNECADMIVYYYYDYC